MPRLKIKTNRYFVSLNDLQNATLQELMTNDLFAKGEESGFIASLLVEVKKCRSEHGNKSKSPVGRPRKVELTEEEEIEKAQAALGLQEDTLSFTDEELAKIEKKQS